MATPTNNAGSDKTLFYGSNIHKISFIMTTKEADGLKTSWASNRINDNPFEIALNDKTGVEQSNLEFTTEPWPF